MDGPIVRPTPVVPIRLPFSFFALGRHTAVFFSSDDRCFQVDILQDAVAVSAAASSESIGRSSRRGGGDAVAPGVAGRGQGQGRREEEEEEEEGEEEKVVSLRLVGLGMQLHSKSYGARFSFSMQDLDLEVRTSTCLLGSCRCFSVGGVLVGCLSDGVVSVRLVCVCCVVLPRWVAQRRVLGGSADARAPNAHCVVEELSWEAWCCYVLLFVRLNYASL